MADRLQYTPGAPPQSTEALGTYLQQELHRVSELIGIISELVPGVQHVAPTKPSISSIAYADGTNWNPGSGEGLYVYKSTGWTFIV